MPTAAETTPDSTAKDTKDTTPANIASMAANPPFIVAFYDPTIDCEDYRGRDINDILAMSNPALERSHDYIQILFPLPEPSPINPCAPVITRDVRDAFYWHPHLRDRLREALDRMLDFYGFGPAEISTDTDGNGRSHSISPVPDSQLFKTRSARTWLQRMNHNHLRITRILRCLRVLGEEGAARAFLTALEGNDSEAVVGARSRMYWDRAMDRAIHLPPDEEDEDAVGIQWLKEAVGFEKRERDGEGEVDGDDAEVGEKDLEAADESAAASTENGVAGRENAETINDDIELRAEEMRSSL